VMAAAAEGNGLRGAEAGDTVDDCTAPADDARLDRSVRLRETSFLSWFSECGLDGSDLLEDFEDPASDESA
jgi:hypothetical protein